MAVAFERTGATAPVPFSPTWPAAEWCCGYCLADGMTAREYRDHMACTHDRPIRGRPPVLAVPSA